MTPVHAVRSYRRGGEPRGPMTEKQQREGYAAIAGLEAEMEAADAFVLSARLGQPGDAQVVRRRGPAGRKAPMVRSPRRRSTSAALLDRGTRLRHGSRLGITGQRRDRRADRGPGPWPGVAAARPRRASDPPPLRAPPLGLASRPGQACAPTVDRPDRQTPALLRAPRPTSAASASSSRRCAAESVAQGLDRDLDPPARPPLVPDPADDAVDQQDRVVAGLAGRRQRPRRRPRPGTGARGAARRPRRRRSRGGGGCPRAVSTGPRCRRPPRRPARRPPRPARARRRAPRTPPSRVRGGMPSHRAK